MRYFKRIKYKKPIGLLYFRFLLPLLITCSPHIELSLENGAVFCAFTTVLQELYDNEF